MGKYKHKKTFPCRHRGFGQYCHRCDQADLLEEFLQKGIMIKYEKNEETGKKEPVNVKVTDKDKKSLTQKIQHLRADD